MQNIKMGFTKRYLLFSNHLRKWGQDQHGLAKSSPCMQWWLDDSGMTLWLNQGFMPKVMSPILFPIKLTLQSSMRVTLQSVSCYAQHTPYSTMGSGWQIFYHQINCFPWTKNEGEESQRLAYWVMDVIAMAYKPTRCVGPSVSCHSPVSHGHYL